MRRATRSRSASEIHKVVSNATASIPTAALSKRGIDRLRILSESKFLHLVHRLVAEEVDRHLHRETESTRQLAGATLAAPSAVPATPGADVEVYVLEEETMDSAGSIDSDLASSALDSPAQASRLDPRDSAANDAGLAAAPARSQHLEAIARLEVRLATLGDSLRQLESLAGAGLALRGEPAPFASPLPVILERPGQQAAR